VKLSKSTLIFFGFAQKIHLFKTTSGSLSKKGRNLSKSTIFHIWNKWKWDVSFVQSVVTNVALATSASAQFRLYLVSVLLSECHEWSA